MSRHSDSSHISPSRIPQSARSAMSSRCSQIQAELDAVNAELDRVRSERQGVAASIVSDVSSASTLRPQDSISSVSSRRSAPSHNHGSQLSIPSRRSQGPSQCTPRSGHSTSSRVPSGLSRGSLSSSNQSSRISPENSQSGQIICQYDPPGSLISTASSSSRQPLRHQASPSSMSSSQYSGSGYQSCRSGSAYDSSMRGRPAGSYYDTKLKVTFELEERSPDMYSCVNDNLRLDEHGEYDLRDDLAGYRGCR